MNDAGNMFGRICLAVLKGEINRKWQRFKYPGREVIFWWTQGPWSACWSRTGSASSHAWCGPRARWTGSQRQPSWTLWWGWIGGPWSAPLSAGHAPVPEQTSSPLLCSSSCRSQELCCRLSESPHDWESFEDNHNYFAKHVQLGIVNTYTSWLQHHAQSWPFSRHDQADRPDKLGWRIALVSLLGCGTWKQF